MNTSEKAVALLNDIGIDTRGISVPVALKQEIDDARAYIARAGDRPRLAEKAAQKAAWLAEAEAELAVQGWTVR
jgi:hypothetical protein